MRLLRLEEGDSVSLTDDLTHDIPPYAILSHTWGPRGEEVIFQDIQNNDFRHKPGYGKILFCGRQAQLDGLDYFWVDTCCIDKTSSAELAESINSMYRWYENAQRCYVYLADMSMNLDRNTPPLLSSWLYGFQNSRWFTRGWTLQELLAPPVVDCFSSNGQKLGDRTSLEEAIHNITNVPILLLRNFSQSNIELQTIFSWCQNRETTRPEDKMYSLLGLARVSMPVIYGEGEGAAFLRLCAEVLQRYPKPGQSLLMFVAQIGHAPALRMLVRGRESIESRNEDGGSLLAVAVANGHEAAIKMLLDEGADIESKDNEGISPLGIAAYYGHQAVIRILLDKGADIESKDNDADSPLALAVLNGHEAAIRVLLNEGANIESKNDIGRSPLVQAARDGREAVVRMLLDEGASIESKDNNGDSSLGIAAYHGHETAICILLDKGADIESKGYNGDSPLATAARYGHEAVIRKLLDKGANIEARNPQGHTPLGIAAFHGHETAIRILLERGADIESKNDKGYSPLELASWRDYEPAIRVLLDKGANIDSKNNNGHTPLARAVKNGHMKATRLLLNKGAKIESTMLSTAAKEPRLRIKELLELEDLKRAPRSSVKELNYRTRGSAGSWESSNV